MKNPKVGERCRIFKNGECAKPIDGMITKYSEKSEWVSFNDDYGTHHSAHRTHLIRLKPKRKPEVIEFEATVSSSGVILTSMPPINVGRIDHYMLGEIQGKKCKVTVEVLSG